MTMERQLDSIEIRRFRGLSELTLKDLGQFNIILGANDVGKTSVLEAAFLLCGFANLRLPVHVQTFRKLPIKQFDDFRTLFHRLDPDRPIHLVGHSSGAVVRRDLKISARYEELDFTVRQQSPFSSEAEPIKRNRRASDAVGRSTTILPYDQRELRYNVTVDTSNGESDSFSATLREKEERFRVDNSSNPRDQETISARFIGPNFGCDPDVVGDLIVRKKARRIVRLLKIFNPQVRDIAISGDTVYLDIGLDQMVPLNAFGTGMLRSTGILSFCMLGEQKVVLIDELENGLHHAAIRSLLRTVLVLSRDQGVQVFATSHSLNILESLVDLLSENEFSDHRDSTCCFTLQRDHAGKVRSYRYGYDQFEHCVRHGIEIR